MNGRRRPSRRQTVWLGDGSCFPTPAGSKNGTREKVLSFGLPLLSARHIFRIRSLPPATFLEDDTDWKAVEGVHAVVQFWGASYFFSQHQSDALKAAWTFVGEKM